MARSTLELEMGLKGTTSKDEVKGGARTRDCIGIVEYLNAKGNEFEWWWRNRERWHVFIYQETIFGGNTGDAGRIP